MSAVRRGGRKNCGGARRPEEDHHEKNFLSKKRREIQASTHIGMLERDLATVRSSKRLNVALPIDERRSSPVIGAVPIEPQNRNQAIKTRVQNQIEL